MIKYLGSKRRLVPVLGLIAGAGGADRGRPVHRHDAGRPGVQAPRAARHRGRHGTLRRGVRPLLHRAPTPARVDPTGSAEALAGWTRCPADRGYVTETFCERARFFQPQNGRPHRRIRDAIVVDHAEIAARPGAADSLIEAADRVDSTTGVQMAYLKKWAPRAHNRSSCAAPALLAGPPARRCGATPSSWSRARLASTWRTSIRRTTSTGTSRTTTSGRRWSRWDAPAHYGIACKRVDARDGSDESPFNSRRTMPAALAAVIARVRCRGRGGLVQRRGVGHARSDHATGCVEAGHGASRRSRSTRRRYVGAQIGIHNPAARRSAGSPPAQHRVRVRGRASRSWSRPP